MSKQAPKLSGIIQRKGSAERPGEAPQRPAATEPVAGATVPADTAPRTKSLTLRLTEAQYERLRDFAHKHRTTHQAVMEEALVRYLDAAKD